MTIGEDDPDTAKYVIQSSLTNLPLDPGSTTRYAELATNHLAAIHIGAAVTYRL